MLSTIFIYDDVNPSMNYFCSSCLTVNLRSAIVFLLWIINYGYELLPTKLFIGKATSSSVVKTLFWEESSVLKTFLEDGVSNRSLEKLLNYEALIGALGLNFWWFSNADLKTFRILVLSSYA